MGIFILWPLWIALSMLAGFIAAQKGRSGTGFFLLSVELSPLVGIIAALVVRQNISKVLEPTVVTGMVDFAAKIREDATKSDRLRHTQEQGTQSMATILVVDDTDADRQIAKIILEAKGHTVLEAETCEAGWQRVRESQPDLVMIDLYMPGMSGLALGERMRADPTLRSIAVVFYTAWHDEPTSQQAIRSYGYTVLAKPISIQELAPRIEAILQEHGALQNRESEPP